jgi:hypothetical protein
MIGKRSGIDFSDFHVEVVQEEETLIHKVRKSDHKYWHAVTFINTQEKMFVTGDYGELIFSRDFHPSASGQVSDGYWLEKMRTGTSQVISNYDSEETRKGLQDWLDNTDDPLDNEEREFIEDLLDYVEDEVEYTYKAYRNYSCVGRFNECENIPFCKSVATWVNIIFDYFEFVCWKMSQEK